MPRILTALLGSAAKDMVDGGPGIDLIFGDSGDTLGANDDAVTLYGGTGRDALSDGACRNHPGHPVA